MRLKKKKTSQKTKKKRQMSTNWVDKVSFQPTSPLTLGGSSACNTPQNEFDATTDFSLISWNILAQNYCRRHNQSGLPLDYAEAVFDAPRRRTNIQRIISRIDADIWALQELDMVEVSQHLRSMGFEGVESPTTKGGGGGGRVDAVALYFKKDKWNLIDHEVVHLDDLATLSSEHSKSIDSLKSNLQGLQQSFFRRNVAIIVRLRHVSSQKTVVFAVAHLYWNPEYEYVKLCQAHYILERSKRFVEEHEPFIFCGDLNSLPGSAVQSYISRGVYNSRQVAPWYRLNVSHTEDTDDNMPAEETVEEKLSTLSITPASSSQVRYILDFNLNHLCRWMRILGLDTALESSEEEELRTSKGDIKLFDRCRDERRVLVTTSTRLLRRKDCPPGAYLINPQSLPNLEVAFVHILLSHGVVLEPSSFLSRCVVCNGEILEIKDSHLKGEVLDRYKAPSTLSEQLDVFQCSCCKQGYWWNERPTSSASRVKTQATRLFQLCLQGSVPIKGELGMFDFVDVEDEIRKGWDHSIPGSPLLQDQPLVLDWLKDEKLSCPFNLTSSYSATDGTKEDLFGESLSFTTVTDDFEGTLDYIFYDERSLMQKARLFVPGNHEELNSRNISKGQLLPSSIWPSDHLAVGTQLSFSTFQKAGSASSEEVATTSR